MLSLRPMDLKSIQSLLVETKSIPILTFQARQKLSISYTTDCRNGIMAIEKGTE